MNAASTHEIREAGPASVAAVSAPNSQPEPMIEPSETNIRPQKPTSLDRCPLGPGRGPLVVLAMVCPIVMLIGYRARAQAVMASLDSAAGPLARTAASSRYANPCRERHALRPEPHV